MQKYRVELIRDDHNGDELVLASEYDHINEVLEQVALVMRGDHIDGLFRAVRVSQADWFTLWKGDVG